MLKMMLDENISPALSGRLWEAGIDTATVRDRGLLEAGDHTIWKLGQDEDRSVVTINAGDFRRLARQTPGHAGLVLIPSGRGRDGQFELIKSVIDSARRENAILPSLRGRIFDVGEDGEIEIELTNSEAQVRPKLKVVK
jgi:hypothetical protein